MKPAPHFPLPILTPRLLLRPPIESDSAAIHEAVVESFDSLSQFMPWATAHYSISDIELFIKQSILNWMEKKNEEPYLPLSIFDKNTGGFLGNTGYHHFDWDVPCIETGYWLRKTASRQGYMTEAVNALTQYAFRQLGVQRIAISCRIDNIRSKKIPERLGFALEGTFKNNRRKELTGELSDTLIYAKYDLTGLPDLKVTWGKNDK